jgi:non-heme chloroperoxidase
MPFVETSDHTQLSFTDWGSGPPILFTHAWGLSSDQWAYQTPSLLGQGFRCLAYDRRGHGRSDRPGTGYDFETLADDLATIIEHPNLHDVLLVGHSVGCREMVRYLTRHGQSRISRLILVAPTTPALCRSDQNPEGFDPSLFEANLAAIAVNVPKWCTDFESIGPYFGTSAKDIDGLVDWTIPRTGASRNHGPDAHRPWRRGFLRTH